MIRCPNCQATLPDGAAYCQFCHTTFAPQGAPPAVTGRMGTGSGSPPTEYAWAWKAYYAVAAWWVFSGLYNVIAPLVNPELGFGALGMVFGAFTAVIGLGLILHLEAARGAVNVMAFLQILGGALGVIFWFFEGGGGISAAIDLIMTIVQILLAGLMIFLIGETEVRPPQ